MVDIHHQLVINASLTAVFQAVSDPEQMQAWWTHRSNGESALGNSYELQFGPEYEWRGRVTSYRPDSEFELEITDADDDWTGTHVGFHLEPAGAVTHVRFYHKGWKISNEHYRQSNYCWALYLRLLKRYVEHGEVVPYTMRLEV